MSRMKLHKLVFLTSAILTAHKLGAGQTNSKDIYQSDISVRSRSLDNLQGRRLLLYQYIREQPLYTKGKKPG